MARVIIAAGSELAAQAGAVVADAGGNAVDAALAATMVSLCTDPGIVAPGAGGYVSIWPANGDPVVIDGYAQMPGLGRSGPPEPATVREVYLEYGGGLHTIVGQASVAVPGAIAAFGRAAERYGNVPWRELVLPAVEAVRRGFPLPVAAAEYLQYSHELIFGWDAASHAALHHADGTPLRAGEIVHIADLPEALETLAAEGPESFYTGSLGERIAREMEHCGGLITRRDLAEYEAVAREPIHADLGGWEIRTNPAPAVGGAAVAAQLMLADPDVDGTSPAGIEQAARNQAAVFGFREQRVDLSDDRNAAVEELLALATSRELLNSPSTAHNSVVDADGNACAITVSAGYGSGWVVPGTGISMNNCLGELELNPAGFLSLRSGQRLISNMAPTVARRPDGAVLAVGSPGASRISSALATVLLALTRDGVSLAEAISRPRLHVELSNGDPAIAYERDLAIPELPDYRLRPFPRHSMYFGGAHSAMWDPADGLVAVTDPRRPGAVAVGGGPQ